MKFKISESGEFRCFTRLEDGEAYRIPIRDILLVLRHQGYPPSAGEIVDLDQTQLQTLVELHDKWQHKGEAAAIRHNKTQATLGYVSWLVVLGVIGLIVWWFLKR